MKKKSFTLIEVLISITIFMFVYFVMSHLIDYLNTSQNFIKKEYIKHSKKEKLLKTLYTDILENYELNITKQTKNFSKLTLTTQNSLYNFTNPFVEWRVNKKHNLIRIESLENKFYYVDNFANVKIFRVFQNENFLFIFIKFIDNKELFFKTEIFKDIK